MKILIIEDAEVRQKRLLKLLHEFEVDCVKNADNGLKLLRENSYDIVFLDHDLIGAKSGSYLTLEWLGNRNDFKTQKPFVIIHSMNAEGTRKMENHLKGLASKIKVVPFKRIILEEVDVVALINSENEK